MRDGSGRTTEGGSSPTLKGRQPRTARPATGRARPNNIQLKQADHMEIIRYPLLYFPINEQTYLGILVGTNHQVIDRDVRNIKAQLSDYLQKQYRKNDSYPYFNVTDPKLKIVSVEIRPSYKDQRGTFPVSHTVKVQVPVVYGKNNQEYYECFLPLFGESFYYYEAQQFKSLVQHFAVNYLNQQSPEQIYRFLMYKKPKLDTVQLKIKSDSTFDWDPFSYQRQYKTLNRLAEQFPYSKRQMRNIQAGPEAAWELEDKVTDVIEALISTRSNVLLVGNHGVGKSAVLNQAIRKIAGQSRQQQLDYTFWRMMAQRITASSKYLGEWEEMVEDLVEELNSANGILWVVDIIQLLQSGGQGAEDSVAAFLLAYLQQGKLQLIGEVTPQELESMRRLLPGFVESFQVILIEELKEEKIQSVLDQFSAYSDKNLRIPIRPEAQSLAYRLLNRYYPYESFPGKGIKFLNRCINEARLNETNLVDKPLVLSTFIQQTGLPDLFLRDDLLLNQDELSGYFNQKIIGQSAAVDKLCSIVKIYKAGLNNPHRPINTLLFAGPTGVGKTASAKALADYFFGKGQKATPLIRIDMSEFQHPSQLSRFLGTGREVGQLVKEVRERPFSVLLLDEIEKADPSVFDLLLTLLDEGVLVDNFGRVTNFRNTIIIMTSNLGANQRNAISMIRRPSEEVQYESAIKGFFRPEFVNRIDGIVLFNALTPNDIRKIIVKELEELKLREGFVKRKLKVEFSDVIVDQLAIVGFDERYGARPLQRAIEQNLVNPIANWLLLHPTVENTILRVDYLDKVVVEQL